MICCFTVHCVVVADVAPLTTGARLLVLVLVRVRECGMCKQWPPQWR